MSEDQYETNSHSGAYILLLIRQERRAVPILLVEDEALLLLMLCEAFEEAGLEVMAAASAEQALACLEAPGTGKVPVMVTDLNLGPGMNGVALADVVRRRCPDLVVVYATGNASWLATQSAAFRRGDRLFGKPYNLAELVGTVCAAAEGTWLGEQSGVGCASPGASTT